MKLIDLISVDVDTVVDVYARVFEGPEWFEQEKCAACGKSYPGPVISRHPGPYSAGDPCWQCGEPLELISFYRDPDERLGAKIVTNAMSQAQFVGVLAELDSELVGFSWGYGLPTTNSPSVLFEEVRRKLRNHDVDADSLFYAAETGVVPIAQRGGVGEALVRERLGQAVAAGFRTAAFRTIDRTRLVGLWTKVLGDGAVTELFSDPDPARDQSWFIGDLTQLRQAP